MAAQGITQQMNIVVIAVLNKSVYKFLQAANGSVQQVKFEQRKDGNNDLVRFTKMLNEKLGHWHFWLFFAGFHLTFDPQHFAGFLGMPRRIFTYEAGRGWEFWNQMSTVGVFIQGISVVLFVYNMIHSYRKGKEAGDDPWDAWTLEWGTTSPPPEYNFDRIPEVRSRRPLWDLKHPEDPDWKFE